MVTEIKKRRTMKIQIASFIFIQILQYSGSFLSNIYSFYFPTSVIQIIEFILLFSITHPLLKKNVNSLDFENVNLKKLLNKKTIFTVVAIGIIWLLQRKSFNQDTHFLIIFIIKSASFAYDLIKDLLLSGVLSLLIIRILEYLHTKDSKIKDKKIKYSSIILIGILILAFALRIYKLDLRDPFIDEYYNLVAAKNFYLNGTYQYLRAPFVTHILKYVFIIFNDYSLWGARFISVLIGTINTFLIYLIGRKQEQKVGLLSSFLFATLPIAIGMSVFVREYEYYLFILLLTFFINIEYQTKRKKYLLVLLSSILIYLLYYFIKIEFSVPAILIVVSNILLLGKEIFSTIRHFYRKNKIITIIVYIILSLAGVYFLFNMLGDLSWFLEDGSFTIHTKYIYLFFYPEYSWKTFFPTWYLGFGPGVLKFFVYLLFTYPLLRAKKNLSYILYYVGFGIFTIPFLILADRYFAARYVYYAFPFYILILSLGITLLIKDFLHISKKLNIKKQVASLSIFIVLLFFFSPFNAIYHTLTLKNGEIDKRTEFMHYNESKLFEKLDQLGYKEGDTVLTTMPNTFIFNKDYDFISIDNIDSPNRRLDGYIIDGEEQLAYDYAKNIFHLHYNEHSYNYSALEENYEKNEKQRISKLISEYREGWIVLDYYRNEKWTENGYNLRSFEITDSKITYLGMTTDKKPFYIYKWTKKEND
jgi:hypothetical protein